MNDLLHTPLYSIPECARYLGLPVSTARGWIAAPGSDSEHGSRPLVHPAGSDPTALSFTNLIELFVLSSLRQNHKAPTDELLKSISARQSRGNSLAWREITGADFCCKRVEYDDGGAPVRFYPFTRGFGREDPKLVIIDPAVSFGRPVIAGSGVRTGVVARRIKGGELIPDVADDYLLETAQIEEAVRYELAV